HRAHASTVGVTMFFETRAMGFLMEKELKYLHQDLDNPAKPFVVIMGGAKVSDKIGVLKALMKKADTILIGGAMANTFFKAQEIRAGAPTRNTSRLSREHGITDGWQAVDIGNATIALFKEEIAKAKTILWNGPVGIFEIPDFAEGTIAIAEALAKSGATTVIGG